MLRVYREEAGLSGVELAARTGLSPGQVSRMERGLSGSIRGFERLAGVLSDALGRRIRSTELMGDAPVLEIEKPTHELHADDTVERIGSDATYTRMLIRCGHDLPSMAIRTGDLLVIQPGALVRSGMLVVVDEGNATRLRQVEQCGSGFVFVSPSPHREGRPGAVLYDPERHEVVGVLQQVSRSY